MYYGVLMNVLLYCYTKQKEILYRLPDTFTEIEEPDIKEKLYEETQADFEKIQANLDSIASREYKLQIERQKNLDMTKMAVMRNSLFTFVCPVKSPVQNAQKEIA